MAKCPKCGGEAELPTKSWELAPKRKPGPKLHIELYACPKCGAKFRTVKKVS